ncbi:MAG: aspartate/glutamate racemase family protein [Pyramidobacter sp.]|nr:aspartate/glutamate racemase family protein [Pyramidobacter sp.]
MTDRKKVGLIRVLTTEDDDFLQAHGRIIESEFPSLSVTSRCIPEQYEGVHDDETERIAIGKVAAEGRRFAQEGFDAVYISCAGDPGVRPLQEELSIPVIGAGIAAAHCALVWNLPVGVLGITDDTPREMKQILGTRIVGSLRPEAIHTTLDLLRPEAADWLTESARQLQKAGAKILVLACTGLATINAAPMLSQRTGIPVIDPLRAAGAMLSNILRYGGRKTCLVSD